MMKNKQLSFTTIAIACIAIVSYAVLSREGVAPAEHVPVAGVAVATTTYLCDNDKQLTAVFYDAVNAPAPQEGKPPTPSGWVELTPKGAQVMHLPQTISADGGRYANTDESFVFWSKGNGAMIQEGGKELTYTGCIIVKPEVGGLPEAYQDSAKGFTMRYPLGYKVEPYAYQAFGPGKDINGVRFTISPSDVSGTNLSSDTYVSIEELPNASVCSADLFLDGAKAKEMNDLGVTYSVASSVGAGAGNRYEETVYAIPFSTPCIAMRYFIHYGVFGNYPAGSVKEFDRKGLLDAFDMIRHTLVVVPKR